jgi:hypothetical protein
VLGKVWSLVHCINICAIFGLQIHIRVNILHDHREYFAHFMKQLILTIVLFNLIAFAKAQNNPCDSSLTLNAHITKEAHNLGEHGVTFFKDEFKSSNRLDDTEVAKDLKLIKQLADITIQKYNMRIYTEDKHCIKVFTAKKNTTNPYRIIEIVTRDSTVTKKIPLKQVNWLLLSNTTPHTIAATIDENGIRTYTIGTKKVYAVRESMISVTDDIDHTSFMQVESLLEKHQTDVPESQHIANIRKVFENYIEQKEHTESAENKELMSKSLRSLTRLDQQKDLELLINVWMYYDPTDYPDIPEVYRIFKNSRPQSIEAVENRMKNKKNWETSETAPYSDLETVLKRLKTE